MRMETARGTRHVVRGAIAAVACTLLVPAAAQTPEQQVVNDAATALGGRERVLAVKTLLLEGAGNFVGITSLRYDDDIGFKSAIEQLRDVRRAYDLANGRARFELTRMVDIVSANQHQSPLAAILGEICDLHLCSADVETLL